jgi:hypothetical protein
VTNRAETGCRLGTCNQVEGESVCYCLAQDTIDALERAGLCTNCGHTGACHALHDGCVHEYAYDHACPQ